MVNTAETGLDPVHAGETVSSKALIRIKMGNGIILLHPATLIPVRIIMRKVTINVCENLKFLLKY